MSDETFEYITTDYMISIESNEQTIQPVEYIVELGQEGIPGKQGEKGDPGFSPTVGYNLSDGHLTFTIVNEDGVTVTPDVFDYVMRKDGSNANSAVNMNRLSILNNQFSGAKIASKYIDNADKMNLEISGYPLRLTGTSFASDTYSNSITIARGGSSITLGNTTKNNIVIDGTSARYNGAEIATRSNIGNGTVILTQGGVTKGSFSVNQSETSVIDLDAGGGVITNPLVIPSDSGNQSLTLGFEPNSSILTFKETLTIEPFPGMPTTVDVPLPIIGSSPSSPVTLTKNETTGISTLGLAYDSTTLGLNTDNELTVIGGGGTTYTAGTGIDITNDVISVDFTDVATATQGSKADTAVQPGDLATVATTGDYTDLLNKPTIPTNSDYVDLTTAQDISGRKYFSNALGVGYNGIDNLGGYQLYIRRNPDSGALTATNALKATNSNKNIDVGTSYTTTNILGSGSRPTYNSNDLALLSDIPTVNNSTITFTQGGTTKGTITLNQSSDATIALDAGGSPDNPLEPLTDKEGLADVTEYAHSTFDKSRFTIVGSPTITNDGIVSGFSSSNYLTANLNFNGAFTFTTAFKATTLNSTVEILRYNVYNRMTMASNGSVGLVANGSLSDTTEHAIALLDIGSILTGVNYLLKVQFNGISSYTTTLTNLDTNTSITRTVTLAYTMPEATYNIFRPIDGSIDLKQFSITVDGVPVFSGNKTGIDTIKPDDYTVVGSPTISADGVASGFNTGSGRIEGSVSSASFSGDWDIYTKFRVSETSSRSQGIIAANGSSTRSFAMLLQTNKKLIVYLSSGGSSWAIGSLGGTTELALNKDYYVRISRQGTTYALYLSEDGINYGLERTLTFATAILDISTLLIGVNEASTLNFHGSIDLNATKIYVNGNLVYQPCLKIPYTLGNGSKVVDSYYRDRIEDAYNYQGYVRYYTLKEDANYTLPTQPDKGYLPNLSWILNNMNSTPNYSAGITMDLGNSNFTAPAKGVIVLAGYTTGQGGSIGGILTVQINSNTVYSNSTSYSGTTYFDLCLPVDSGDVIGLVAITTPATINTQKFFPLKEVN